MLRLFEPSTVDVQKIAAFMLRIHRGVQYRVRHVLEMKVSRAQSRKYSPTCYFVAGAERSEPIIKLWHREWVGDPDDLERMEKITIVYASRSVFYSVILPVLCFDVHWENLLLKEAAFIRRKCSNENCGQRSRMPALFCAS